MRDLQELKQEIHRRGEERIIHIAKVRRRTRAICGGAVLCGAMALVVTTFFTANRTPVPLGTDTTTTIPTSVTTTVVSPHDTTSPPSSESTDVSAVSTTGSTEVTQDTDRTVVTTVDTTVQTTVGTTVPPTTVPTAVSTTGSTSPTTVPSTTTTTKHDGGMLPPLGAIVHFVRFSPVETVGTVGELFTVPFSSNGTTCLVKGSLTVAYDANVMELVAVNGEGVQNPYVNGIAATAFPDGTAFSSSKSEDGTVRIEFDTHRSVGNHTNGEPLFRLTFKALAPASYSEILISDLNFISSSSNPEEDFVWSFSGNFVHLSVD